MTPVSESSLTPTEYLVGELLAARLRLGERWWTLRNDTKPAAVKLERAGLVDIKSGIVEHTYQARLTPDGELQFLSLTYVPPALAKEH